MTTDPKEIARLLAEPFPAEALGFKPQAVSKDGKKGLAVAFIDARNVIDRLNAVLGVDGWEDHFRDHPQGVYCSLRVRIGMAWTEHEDFGGFSDQPDQGDKHKAAVSDALKRAAVKLGVGRYLYDLELGWHEIDQWKKFVKTPTLPAWALPQKPAAKPDAETVEVWKARLDGDPTLAEMNGMIGELKQMNEPTKAAVWSLAKGWAERAGYLWEKEKKAFHDSKKAGAA